MHACSLKVRSFVNYPKGLALHVDRALGVSTDEHFRAAERDPYTDSRMTAPPHHLDDSRMRRLLGYCLAQATAVGNRVFDEHIGVPLALRRVDYTILVLVDANPDATNRQLARLLDLSMPYLTITLDKLVARGLVTRTRSEADRRSSLLRLTDEGRALLREAEDIAGTMEKRLLSHLTSGERGLLFELLRKVWSSRRSETRNASSAKRR
jgi:DNA-binding MarR family transcriptional regulator